jgi:hypothetical protein
MLHFWTDRPTDRQTNRQTVVVLRPFKLKFKICWMLCLCILNALSFLCLLTSRILYCLKFWRHDTQHNVIRHNNKYKDTQDNDRVLLWWVSQISPLWNEWWNISKLLECQLGNLEKLPLRLHHNMKCFVYVEKEKHFRMNQFGDSRYCKMLWYYAILLVGIKVPQQQYRGSVIRCNTLNKVFQKLSSGHTHSLPHLHA